MCPPIVQFAIPRLVVGETEIFAGNLYFLADRCVEAILARDPKCIALMRHFINEEPDLWAEDIAGDM